MFKRTLLIATGLVPALLMSACASTGTENRGLESIHQPVVARSDYTLDVATGGNGLAPGEDQRLAGWMASLHVGYGDQIAIDSAGAYDSGVRDAVARQASRYGLLVSEDAPFTNSPVAAGTIRVVVSRMKASVPGCPDFSRVHGPDFEGQTASNYGCAVNSNLAAMVASPGDLVRGQVGNSVIDPMTASKAIDLYRRAIPTGGGGTTVKADSPSSAGSK